MRCGLIDTGNRNHFRMKATRLFFLVFPLFFSCGLSAQNKHTIRIGAGVNVRSSVDDDRLRVGPSLAVEYGRTINAYFSVAAEIHTDMCKNGAASDLYGAGVGLRGMFTPFPKKFRWVKVGVGATYDHCKYLYGVHVQDAEGQSVLKHMRHSADYWGIDFPIRGYLIDSRRFEFYAFYNIKTMFSDGRYYWNYSHGGLAFGVKF